jgi:hypothetical protein
MRPALSRPPSPTSKRLVPLPEKARKIVAGFRSRFRIEDSNTSGSEIAAVNAIPAWRSLGGKPARQAELVRVFRRESSCCRFD